LHDIVYAESAILGLNPNQPPPCHSPGQTRCGNLTQNLTPCSIAEHFRRKTVVTFLVSVFVVRGDATWAETESGCCSAASLVKNSYLNYFSHWFGRVRWISIEEPDFWSCFDRLLLVRITFNEQCQALSWGLTLVEAILAIADRNNYRRLMCRQPLHWGWRMAKGRIGEEKLNASVVVWDRRSKDMTGLRQKNRFWSCRSGVVLWNSVLSRSSSSWSWSLKDTATFQVL